MLYPLKHTTPFLKNNDVHIAKIYDYFIHYYQVDSLNCHLLTDSFVTILSL